MTKAEMESGFQKIWDLFAATDREFKELKQLFVRTDEKINALDGKWGRFVEGLVVPGVKRLFGERGIALEKVYPRAEAHKQGETIEIDVLAVGEEHVVMVEVKSTLSVDDVKEHLQELGRFKAFFPEYADRKVLGAVAGIVIEHNVSRYAYQQGLFVIGQSGDAVRLLNDDKFRPKAW